MSQELERNQEKLAESEARIETLNSEINDIENKIEALKLLVDHSIVCFPFADPSVVTNASDALNMLGIALESRIQEKMIELTQSNDHGGLEDFVRQAGLINKVRAEAIQYQRESIFSSDSDRKVLESERDGIRTELIQVLVNKSKEVIDAQEAVEAAKREQAQIHL